MITAYYVHEHGFAVPRTIDELRRYLQAAIEVEHLTIPVYMTGMYTIRPGTNSEAYYAIRSVLLEEMLHMTLAANLLNAIGGKPKVEDPEFIGEYPAQLPMSSGKLPEIGLRHFSREALDTFLAIEKPRSFDTEAEKGAGWTSIGQFYATIAQGLSDLVGELGETSVFTGDPRSQVGPEHFYNSGGEVFEITNRKTALKAIEVISEQGEGTPGSIWDTDDFFFGQEQQPAHYFRFKEIAQGRRYTHKDHPKHPPSGPSVAVDWTGAYKIKGESKVADYERYKDRSAVYDKAVEFNNTYALLLSCLHMAFNGAPSIMGLAVPFMLEMRDRAEQLYRNPHPDPACADQGLFASATFEITKHHLNRARVQVQEYVAAAELRDDAPMDLSGITAGTRGRFA